MAKFTRTTYASGSLSALAREIAHQSGLDQAGSTYAGLTAARAGKGRKRVRITILVEPEAAPPKRASKPRRPRPVQQALPLPDPEPPRRFAMRLPLFGADGGPH